MADTLEIFGTEYTGVTGIKATDSNSQTKVYIRPQGTKSITANGAGQDVVGYATVDVSVPNTYAAGDEGKVVSSGALVAQTSDTVTQNGTVDTTLINSLTVNVSSSAPTIGLGKVKIVLTSGYSGSFRGVTIKQVNGEYWITEQAKTVNATAKEFSILKDYNLVNVSNPYGGIYAGEFLHQKAGGTSLTATISEGEVYLIRLSGRDTSTMYGFLLYIRCLNPANELVVTISKTT